MFHLTSITCAVTCYTDITYNKAQLKEVINNFDVAWQNHGELHKKYIPLQCTVFLLYLKLCDTMSINFGIMKIGRQMFMVIYRL